MSSKIRFKSQYRIKRLEPNKVFLLAENTSYVLTGNLYYQLAPLLDGTHTAVELANAVNGSASFFDVNRALYLLRKKGYVVDVNEKLPPAIEMMCHVLNLNTEKAAERVSTTRVFAVSISEDVPVTDLKGALNNVGLPQVDSLEDANLCLVLTDDYLSTGLHRFHEWAAATGNPWLPVKPTGIKRYIGPLLIPGENGCLHCLTQRMRLHRKVERALQYETGSDLLLTPPMVNLPSATLQTIGAAVTAVVHWLIQGDHEKLTQNIIVSDTFSGEQETHPFIKRPQCAYCGNPELIKQQALRPVKLESCPKLFTRDGGHRSVTPEDTFNRFSKHISKVSGVLGTFERTGDSNTLVHSYNAGQNVFYPTPSFSSLRFLLRNGDGGKGASDAQSKTSGLCEALERYSASLHGDEYFIETSYEALGDLAIHPNDCMNYSSEQYQTTNLSVATDTYSLNQVPKLFDPQKTYRWTPVWSLTEKRFKYLPTGYCYYNDLEESHAFPACSNGNAAGNTIEEAILQGFMELAERDSVGIWWYNRIQRPVVDLASFNDPYICNLIEYYHGLNRELWVLDVTNDLGIPTFAAISRKRGLGVRELLIYGFGTHFDPRIGILRALTELNQCLTTFAELEEGEIPKFNAEATEWWETATISNQPYLEPHPNLPARTCSDYHPYTSRDIKTDVEQLVEIMAQNGMETLVLDQTRPDIGLNVVKVFVPGLCHFWRRMGAKRLYEVPVKLGWRQTPLSEVEMNPYSIFL